MITPNLTDLLKATSRSFFLSLQLLPPSMRPSAGLAYLLCRTADTVADESAASLADRLHHLNRFFDLMDRFPQSLKEWDQLSQSFKELSPVSSSAETQLLFQLPEMMSYLTQLSRTDQVLIQKVVQGVIQGMRMDLKSFGADPATLKALKTDGDLESYLNWIGGEPGRFWSELTLAHFPGLSVLNQTHWIDDGIRLGTGLQMINILRDLPRDLSRGRCYIPLTRLSEQTLTPEQLTDIVNTPQFLPLYHRLIDDTLVRLESGLRYVEGIPKKRVALRLAAWSPLALGLKTATALRQSEAVLDPRNRVKISRSMVMGISTVSVGLVGSNTLLRMFFEVEKRKASS